MHICVILNGICDFICKTEIETQTQRTNVMDTKGEAGEWDELGDWDWHMYPIDTIYKTDNKWKPTV